MRAPVTRDQIILGLAALVLVVFSLVVSMLVPRWRPDFPGRNLGLFAVVSVLLVIGMLGAVELFGAEEEHAAAAGEAGGAGGQQVFDDNKCGTCHTLAAADASGSVGPKLDEALKNKDKAFVEESIVNPDAFVEKGFADNLMPETYGEDLSREELDALVAFLVESTRGS
jgi:mono/diheme cytochrome c family protein